MVWLLNSDGMKTWKSTESFCLSILTIFTNDWSWIDMFTVGMFIFYSATLMNRCKPRTGWFTSIGILWKWARNRAKQAGDGQCRRLGYIRSKLFLKMKVIIFQWCAIKQAVFLLGQPAPYNQLLIQPLCIKWWS